MVEVKICGLQASAEVEIVNEAAPDYVGFVFAQSKRRVQLEEARRLRLQLRREIKAVGVFVNSSLPYLEEAAQACRLDVIQLHGDESAALCLELIRRGWTIWKACSLADSLAATEEQLQTYARLGRPLRLLLDAAVPGQRGGTGCTCDWRQAAFLARRYPVVLAGGLAPDNIQEAVRIVAPLGVDVSSGVEQNGQKDRNLVVNFVQKVRECVDERRAENG